ncbi:proactivator polypeptide-like 1 [Phodopus roborovskii]|uniref:Proactivator polypeptide-like 1 n=1 Tax=Phodopus roborovskii TaxID=109678 RepID=A0AAU9ZZD4_PHORO|nr:proactivator polypeptide-like 1 [Phodopus roborovskii]CAH6979167.1 Psapl1 [Phodopus roborovskii]
MLGTLILLFGLLGAAKASPISGPQECAKGSEVWCQDLQAAARCQAVRYCQSAVWSKPIVRSLPCSVCQDVAAAAGNGMNPDATEADILASVTKTCEWLPSPESSAKCKWMVDNHSPAVLGMLSRTTGTGPAPVCTALTLCEPLQRHLPTATSERPLTQEDATEMTSPFLSNGALSFHPSQMPSGVVCQDCIQLISRLQGALESNLTLAEVTVQDQCESLGSGLAALCKNYIRQQFVPAKQMLQILPSQEVCRKGGFCEEWREPVHRLAQVAAVDGVPSLELELPRKNEIQMQLGLTCDVCLNVIQEVDKWLTANSTEALITHALERVCSIMPESLVQQCITLVETYSPNLVQLVSRITPEKVCETIRLCNSRRQARSISKAEATTPSLLVDEENYGSFCQGCKRILGVSSQNLDRKSTKRDILNAFKGGCRILPLPYVLQCHRFVAEYEPVLIESLRFMMDPNDLCKKMGACHSPRVPLLGTDQCVMGPSFWCKSPEAAEMCDALEHCQRLVWKKPASEVKEQP